jgi:hypothetical protein
VPPSAKWIRRSTSRLTCSPEEDRCGSRVANASATACTGAVGSTVTTRSEEESPGRTNDSLSLTRDRSWLLQPTWAHAWRRDRLAAPRTWARKLEVSSSRRNPCVDERHSFFFSSRLANLASHIDQLGDVITMDCDQASSFDDNP